MAPKKAFLILVVFLIGNISLYAQVSAKVNAALSQFESEYPEYAGKAYTTSNERTWQRQLEIILERPNSYPATTAFKTRFKKDPPRTTSGLSSEELEWFKNYILERAGLPTGFAHVGGNAVDVSVRNLNSQGTQLLARVLQNNGLSILYEKDDRYDRSYFTGTLVLHCSY
ncbi:hypothetical protein FACS1894137_19700 [Spirochaetia bacterium]|nr:hypothetical protein FACS1894137_19700 [Spirochaetia bacterium]